MGVFRLRSRQPPVTNVQGNVAMLSNSTCLCTLAAQLPHAKASCGGADQHATSSSANSSTICRQSRGVVFLQHALMDSSAGWLLLGPERSLALQLADAGFDLWLGNSRGNRFSRNHTHLRPDQAAFWAWSWQHQASHDLPATIDYVLQVTQQQQLVFVGYSQVTRHITCLVQR